MIAQKLPESEVAPGQGGYQAFVPQLLRIVVDVTSQAQAGTGEGQTAEKHVRRRFRLLPADDAERCWASR